MSRDVFVYVYGRIAASGSDVSDDEIVSDRHMTVRDRLHSVWDHVFYCSGHRSSIQDIP